MAQPLLKRPGISLGCWCGNTAPHIVYNHPVDRRSDVIEGLMLENRANTNAKDHNRVVHSTYHLHRSPSWTANVGARGGGRKGVNVEAVRSVILSSG